MNRAVPVASLWLVLWMLVPGHGVRAKPVSADRRAVACMQGNDADEKIDACTALLQDSHGMSKFDQAKYLGYRGWAYIQKQDLKKALADLDMSIAVDGGQFGAYGSRAGVYRTMGEFDKALADIDKCIQLVPRFAPARTVRGDILRAKGDNAAALAEYDAALRIDPTELGAFSGRAQAHRGEGRFDDAEADLLRAMALDNRVAELYTTQGLIAESRHDIAKARAAYTRALAMPQSVRFTNKPGNPIIDATEQQRVARARLAVLDEAEKSSQDAAHDAAVAKAGDRGKPRKLALVIGNGAYRSAATLVNPPNDARLLAQSLRGIGFETTEGIDLDRDGMRKAINILLLNAPAASIAIIYYAGHGVQIDGKNYLVPVDARLGETRDVASELIDLDFIMAGLDDKLRANVIVLDACRNDPFQAEKAKLVDASRAIAIRSGLAPQAGLATAGSLGAGTLVAFATAPGQVALDGAGADSPFSTALARHIATPGLEVQQMLTRVRAEVVATTQGKQVPWSNSSLLGEVYLTSP